MDLTTNGVVITGVIKFVQTNKEKLTMSTKEENNGKESKKPDYDDDRELQEEFRLFYDFLLVDIHMPKMDGFEFAAKVLEQDINVRTCFITAAEIDAHALKVQYPTLSIGCFHKKANHNSEFG
ncbi:hypothetical protein BH18THE2_BH18THE2_33380 [soil metagenome]